MMSTRCAAASTACVPATCGLSRTPTNVLSTRIARSVPSGVCVQLKISRSTQRDACLKHGGTRQYGDRRSTVRVCKALAPSRDDSKATGEDDEPPTVSTGLAALEALEAEVDAELQDEEEKKPIVLPTQMWGADPPGHKSGWVHERHNQVSAHPAERKPLCSVNGRRLKSATLDWVSPNRTLPEPRNMGQHRLPFDIANYNDPLRIKLSTVIKLCTDYSDLRPNAGKSTLMNAMVGAKLSIVTSKAQTTRHRVLGIVSEEGSQMILLDTPGVVDTERNKMENFMMNSVKTSVKDADVVVVMVDAAGATNPRSPKLDLSSPLLHNIMTCVDILLLARTGKTPKEALNGLLPPSLLKKGCPIVIVLNKCDLLSVRRFNRRHKKR
eukprot:4154845-Pyramimonas_sp.AAC.1